MSDKLKIALIGYGSMGKEIHRLSEDKDYIVTDIFDLKNKIDENKEYDFDVAIDFTFPEYVFDNVTKLAKMGKNIVLGTTGWYDREDELKSIVEKYDVGLVWGSNFSIGVQMFFRMVNKISEIVDKVEDFDIMMHEMHHYRKKDSPSGTAETLANIILENVARKTSKEINAIQGDVDRSKLHVSSTRGGEITGRHTIYIDSISDSIEVTHRAKNRSGFALGSLSAATWIKDKKGFYVFDDVLDSIWG